MLPYACIAMPKIIIINVCYSKEFQGAGLPDRIIFIFINRAFQIILVLQPYLSSIIFHFEKHMGNTRCIDSITRFLYPYAGAFVIINKYIRNSISIIRQLHRSFSSVIGELINHIAGIHIDYFPIFLIIDVNTQCVIHVQGSNDKFIFSVQIQIIY